MRAVSRSDVSHACCSSKSRTAAARLARLLRQMKSTHSHRNVSVTNPEPIMINTNAHTGKLEPPPRDADDAADVLATPDGVVYP